MKIHDNKNKKQATIAGPYSQRDYMKYFNALTIIITTDTSIRQPSVQSVTTLESSAGHWNLLFKIYLLYYYLAKSGIGKSEWNKYLNRNNGRHEFKIYISVSLINFAIALDWDGESKRPGWMHQSDFVPCICGMCFFS